MKNWKKAIALVASAAALVSVAACGPSNAGGSSDSGKKTVGFVAVGPEGGFRTANEKDIQKAFEDAGFDLTYSPTQNNDQQKQLQAFNKFVNDEVDAIILSSTEDSGWDDSLKKAAEAEIPVFTVDRNVDVKDAEAKKARQELAKIQEEWDQIGYVPRDDMRRIENRLDADDKQIKDIEDAAWKQTDPEADARKSSFEEQLNAQLAELDAKSAAESDPKKKAKLESEKATKEQWLNAIK